MFHCILTTLTSRLCWNISSILVSEFTGNIIRLKISRILAKMMFDPVTTQYEMRQKLVKEDI